MLALSLSTLDGIWSHDFHLERVATTPGWSARADAHQAEGEGVEPSRVLGIAPRPGSSGVASPIGVPFRCQDVKSRRQVRSNYDISFGSCSLVPDRQESWLP